MHNNKDNYCPVSALCTLHTNGEGCVIRHFPGHFKTCDEYQRLLAEQQKKE